MTAPVGFTAETRFDHIHRTPVGVVAFGRGKRFLVAEGTGAPGELPAREVVLTDALTITADSAYVYELYQGRTLELRRYRLDTLTLVDTWSPAELAYLGSIEPGASPRLVAIDEGQLLGFTSQFGKDVVSTLHLLARWQESISISPAEPRLNPVRVELNSFATLGYVSGAYGMAQLAYSPTPPPTIVQAFRLDGPDAAPVVSTPTGPWRTVLQNEAGVVAPVYQQGYLALNCTSTFAMSTRWGNYPLLSRLDGIPSVTELMPVMTPAPDGSASVYLGGTARWSLATDTTALYVARSGAVVDQPDSSDRSRGEIFVFDLNSTLVARIDAPGQVNQLVVGDCFLYWLDEVGALQRLRKPGPQCTSR